MLYFFLMGAFYAFAAVIMGLATAYAPWQDRPAKPLLMLAARYAGLLAFVGMCIEIWVRFGWISSIIVIIIGVLTHIGFALFQHRVVRHCLDCAASDQICELRRKKAELESKLAKSQSETRQLRKRVSTQPMLDPTP